MRYRKLDPVTGLRVFGGDQNAFYIDQPEAVAQAVLTRLRLWTGQWFLKLPDGTPYETQVLGKYTGSTRDIAIRNRILQTPGVTAIVAYSSVFNGTSRNFDIAATIDTIYGQVQLAGPI